MHCRNVLKYNVFQNDGGLVISLNLKLAQEGQIVPAHL